MSSSIPVLLTAGIAIASAIIGGLWLSSQRAVRSGRVERRMQAVVDAFAEREIAREQARRAARRSQRSTPHGKNLQLN